MKMKSLMDCGLRDILGSVPQLVANAASNIHRRSARHMFSRPTFVSALFLLRLKVVANLWLAKACHKILDIVTALLEKGSSISQHIFVPITMTRSSHRSVFGRHGKNFLMT